MKAVRIHSFGGISGTGTLSHDEIDIPTIQDDEILIKVVASAVNPVDWRVRDGYLKDMVPHQLPLTLGWDVAGVVERVGNAVNNIAVGQEVYALADITRNGAYALLNAYRKAETWLLVVSDVELHLKLISPVGINCKIGIEFSFIAH